VHTILAGARRMKKFATQQSLSSIQIKYEYAEWVKDGK
jgi:hypothetical protein